MYKCKTWNELRDLWQSLTKIPRDKQGIIALEQFILGYNEGQKELSITRSVLGKILNEGDPKYTEKEVAVIKQIIDEYRS